MNLTTFAPLVTVLFLATGSDTIVQGQTPGIAPKPLPGHPEIPASEGFMVPYSRTIPGTNVSFEMVGVPGGVFSQGTEERIAGPGESPSIEVAVSPFWIGRYEVTWAEYKAFMRITGLFETFEERGIRVLNQKNAVDAVTGPSKLYDPSFTFLAGEDPRQPAVSMSQYAAKQYTKWLSLLTGEFYRLPTESEWEYACRAGSESNYCYGEEADPLGEYAWFEDNSDFETHVVGQKQPNTWGLYDMHGNAAEWVLDEYREDWYGSLPAKRLSSDDTLCWPAKLYPRVLRGGCMNSPALDCRSASRRASNDDELRSYDPNSPKSPWWFASDEGLEIGFRIVRPIEDIPREGREKFWQADIESIRRDVDRRINKEGRGERGLVDPQLPEAAKELQRELTQQKQPK